MARQWVRDGVTNTQSAAGSIQNSEIFHNNSASAGTTQKFMATVVANFLYCHSDGDDTWYARYVVVHESFPTLSLSVPAVEDDKTRGLYPFAKGPVYFNPRAAINIPADHKLFLQLVKKDGSTSATARLFWNTLIVTS